MDMVKAGSGQVQTAERRFRWLMDDGGRARISQLDVSGLRFPTGALFQMSWRNILKSSEGQHGKLALASVEMGSSKSGVLSGKTVPFFHIYIYIYK
jgi:hypothetical protein